LFLKSGEYFYFFMTVLKLTANFITESYRAFNSTQDELAFKDSNGEEQLGSLRQYYRITVLKDKWWLLSFSFHEICFRFYLYINQGTQLSLSPNSKLRNFTFRFFVPQVPLRHRKTICCLGFCFFL
jgi:hypothetical protein